MTQIKICCLRLALIFISPSTHPPNQTTQLPTQPPTHLTKNVSIYRAKQYLMNNQNLDHQINSSQLILIDQKLDQ